MNILTSKYTWIFSLIIIVCVFIAVTKCHSSNEQKRTLNQDLKASNDSVHHFVLRDGTRTAEKTSFIISKDDFKNTVIVRKDSLKKLKERIGNLNHLTNELRLQLSLKGKISVPFHDTLIIYEKDSQKGHAFTYQDSWLKMQGTLFKDSFNTFYKVCADLDIATYWKRQGLFKPDLLEVNVISSNPHLEINKLNNYSIQEPKRFYETRGFAFAAGLIAGLFVPK